MTAQFSEEDVESIFAEPEGDVEKPHLVTHAKVYAIAEKYVLPMSFFPLWDYDIACTILNLL